MTKEKKSTKETPLVTWLWKVIREQETFPFHFAKQLGVSHATVSRWLSGHDIPRPKTCEKLANLTGEPLLRILALAGHITETPEQDLSLPSFREYMARKYPEDKYPLASKDFVAVMARGLDRQSVA